MVFNNFGNFVRYELRRGTYTQYNNEYNVRDLDMNTLKPTDRPTQFPTGLYEGPSFMNPTYICDKQPRNSETNYLLGVERFDHPDHFSRYGYANCSNGYCRGPQAGRNYNTAENCPDPIIPQDMAPKRFYNYSNIYGVNSVGNKYEGSGVFK